MNVESWSPKVLSLLRFVAGLLFFEHGLQKILHFPPAMAAPAAAGAVKAAAGLPPMMAAAGYIELVCGFLLALGLFGRWAALIASGEMAFAYFLVHAHKSQFPVNNQGDAAILFCFVFFYIIFAGSGPFSLDRAMDKTS